MTMTGADVEAAVAFMTRVLASREADDWTVAAGPLVWSCWETTAHVAHDLLAYAGQVVGTVQTGYLPMNLAVDREATPADLLNVVGACGQLLGVAVTAADPEARAWHWGPTDPGGFAALGVNEVLVHTFDVTAGLGLPWQPPPALCSAVLERLFPDAPQRAPEQALLWCTGRTDLEHLPRPTSWTVRAALPRP
jgi:hypothetical protein